MSDSRQDWIPYRNSQQFFYFNAKESVNPNTAWMEGCNCQVVYVRKPDFFGLNGKEEWGECIEQRLETSLRTFGNCQGAGARQLKGENSSSCNDVHVCPAHDSGKSLIV